MGPTFLTQICVCLLAESASDTEGETGETDVSVGLRKITGSIAARPPDPRAEPDVIPGGEQSSSLCQDLDGDHADLTTLSGEGGGMNSQILLEDGMDANQRLLVPRTSTSCMAISGTDYRNQLTSECSRSLRCAQHSSRRSVFPS